MSIAPAKSASMAAGPALKVLHSIFTFGPSAFSKEPFALPTMACACVMLGNAPTRTVTGNCAMPGKHAAHTRVASIRNRRTITNLYSHWLARSSEGLWSPALPSWFSLAVESAFRFDHSRCPLESCSPGCGQPHRVRRERPDTARGGVRPCRSEHATDLHHRREPGGRQSGG